MYAPLNDIFSARAAVKSEFGRTHLRILASDRNVFETADIPNDLSGSRVSDVLSNPILRPVATILGGCTVQTLEIDNICIGLRAGEYLESGRRRGQ